MDLLKILGFYSKHKLKLINDKIDPSKCEKLYIHFTNEITKLSLPCKSYLRDLCNIKIQKTKWLIKFHNPTNLICNKNNPDFV